MILTMDVGNTNIKFGLWNRDQMDSNWRISTSLTASGDELGLVVDNFLRLQGRVLKDVDELVVGSVVLPMRPAIERLGTRYLGKPPIFVEAHSQRIMPILYYNPREVGADRVVGAISAYRKIRSSLVVVDFGTATTFDCITKRGEYLGGAIAPGFRLSADALFDKARRLPKLEQFYKPRAAIGYDTASSLNSGLVLGYAGLVEGMVGRIKAEMGEARVVATGGLAGLIAGETTVISEIMPNLTLEGLKIVYDEGAY
ncbi:MAG: type III pantothenate kinase [Deltaproteobacteria bacterium]|jgi:type III pantothenate kinase|nr:type III pantothenate kinase [Deltaproteobacteria bacterium]